MADEEKDLERFTDWDEDTIEVLEEGTQEPETDIAPPAASNGSVVYEGDQVIAYFDALNHSVPAAFATWAKVWTPTDTGGMVLQIVSLADPDVNSLDEG